MDEEGGSGQQHEKQEKGGREVRREQQVGETEKGFGNQAEDRWGFRKDEGGGKGTLRGVDARMQQVDRKQKGLENQVQDMGVGGGRKDKDEGGGRGKRWEKQKESGEKAQRERENDTRIRIVERGGQGKECGKQGEGMIG